MSGPTFIFMLAVIACLPAAIRVGATVRVNNPTAFALVAMWLFSRAVWHLTGEWLPIKAMVMQDMFVIAVMFVKDDWVTCDYRNRWHQLACLWHERTPWDKAILALFPVAWLFYAPILEANLQFWTLWGIGLAQLALSGLEVLHQWRRVRGHALRADAPGNSPGSFFAPVSGGAYD